MDRCIRTDAARPRTRPALRAAALVLLLLAVGTVLGADGVRAWLDRDTIELGESVTLNIEADRLDAEPDFSPLRAEFELLGTSSRTQITHGTGGSRTSTLRAVVLQPRRVGELTIPPIQVGAARTEPVTLTVRPVHTPRSGAGEDVFLEVEAEPVTPYVQQQVRYTLRLYYAVTLLEGQLEEPKADHMEVRRLGQDRSRQVTLQGRRYNVVERHYAMIPERSGELELAPAVFRGRAILPGRRSTWIGAGSPVSARSESMPLEVRPRPASAADPWLPAAELTLEDVSGTWPDTLQVGEPWTLTVRATARGLGAAQLPELELPSIDGAEVYPDRPETRDGNEGAWLVGVRERKFAIVPDAAGELHIPAMELHWWDTDSDQPQLARIPSRTVRVEPARVGAPDRAAAPAQDAPVAIAVAQEPGTEAAPSPWPWLAAAFALAWLVTLGWAWRLRRQGAHAAAARSVPVHDAPQLRRAVAGNDLGTIAGALRAEARRQGLPSGSLGALAESLQDPLQREALAAIEAARFGGGDTAHALTLARRAFGRGRLAPRVAGAAVADDGPLPPLYPR